MLLRGLLDLPNSPAILALHVPALSFSQIALGGDVHFGPAQFYDVPMLSLRNAIMDDIFANSSLADHYFAHNKIGTDTRHVSCAPDGADFRSDPTVTGFSASSARRTSTANYARWTVQA